MRSNAHSGSTNNLSDPAAVGATRTAAAAAESARGSEPPQAMVAATEPGDASRRNGSEPDPSSRPPARPSDSQALLLSSQPGVSQTTKVVDVASLETGVDTCGHGAQEGAAHTPACAEPNQQLEVPSAERQGPVDGDSVSGSNVPPTRRRASITVTFVEDDAPSAPDTRSQDAATPALTSNADDACSEGGPGSGEERDAVSPPFVASTPPAITPKAAADSTTPRHPQASLASGRSAVNSEDAMADNSARAAPPLPSATAVGIARAATPASGSRHPAAASANADATSPSLTAVARSHNRLLPTERQLSAARDRHSDMLRVRRFLSAASSRSRQVIDDGGVASSSPSGDLCLAGGPKKNVSVRCASPFGAVRPAQNRRAVAEQLASAVAATLPHGVTTGKAATSFSVPPSAPFMASALDTTALSSTVWTSSVLPPREVHLSQVPSRAATPQPPRALASAASFAEAEIRTTVAAVGALPAPFRHRVARHNQAVARATLMASLSNWA